MLAPMVAHSSDTFLCGHVPPSAFDPKTRQRTTSTQPASWNWAEHQPAREVKACEGIVRELDDGNAVVAAVFRGNDIRSIVRIPRCEYPLKLCFAQTVQMFKPSQWFAGVLLLVLRLLQTTFMALVASQLVQATIMCFITLLSISMQSELAPYRRASDNHVALLAHWLVFLWVSTLLLRIVGMFQRPAAALALGTLLCIATACVFVVALVLANVDRLKEKYSARRRADLNELSAESSNVAEPPLEIELVAMGQEETAETEQANAPHPGELNAPIPDGANNKDEAKSDELHSKPSLSPWSALLNEALCGAEEPPADIGTVLAVGPVTAGGASS